MDNSDCPFCSTKDAGQVFRNELWFAKWDTHPVTKGHLLIVPVRHVQSYFDTTREEKLSFLEMIEKSKELLDAKFKPDGYNIGMNLGKAAGQTVMHFHLHVIPRYRDDAFNPRGGIRGVIKDRQARENRA